MEAGETLSAARPLGFGSVLTNLDFRVALVSTSPQAVALARDWLVSLPVLNKYCRPLD